MIKKPFGRCPFAIGARKSIAGRGCGGITLIELVVAMAIVGFLILVSGVNLYESASRNDVLNCAKRITADIKEARRWAQGGGARIIVLFSARSGQDRGPRDLDRARDADNLQHDEFFIVFPDSGNRARWQGGYKPDVRRHGVRGDPLCDEDILFLGESTLSSTVPRSSSKVQLYFSTVGTLLNFGSANKNLYLEKNGHVARIEVVGLTGSTRTFINKASYSDCGGGNCTVGTWTNGVNSQWQPIQGEL